MWGSPAPLCVPLLTHLQPQSVLCATGGSTALSRRGCPQRMGGWSCTRGGGSGAQGCSEASVPSASSWLVWGKGQRKGGGGEPWGVERVTLGSGVRLSWSL